MWLDSNDTLNTFVSMLPKDPSNVMSGVHTYGASELMIYMDTYLYDMWLMFADNYGLGIGVGLLAASFSSRLIFAPLIIYSVSCLHSTHPKSPFLFSPSNAFVTATNGSQIQTSGARPRRDSGVDEETPIKWKQRSGEARKGKDEEVAEGKRNLPNIASTEYRLTAPALQFYADGQPTVLQLANQPRHAH